MTTPAREKLYEAEHLAYHEGLKTAIYNPNNLSIDKLPMIYGINNGGRPGWLEGVLVAEDGICLGGHICSTEAYMPADLGILEGTRPDRHKVFRNHYPDGYRMEFVSRDHVNNHKGVMEAYRLNQEQGGDND